MLDIENTIKQKRGVPLMESSGLDTAKERISLLKNMSVEISQIKVKRKEKELKKMDQLICELWYNFKRCMIHAVGISEKEKILSGLEEIIE